MVVRGVLFLSVVIVLLPAMAGAAEPATAQAGGDDDAMVAAQVRALGGPDFLERKRATSWLWRHGRAAEPALRAASAGRNPEAATRARALLLDIRYGISP